MEDEMSSKSELHRIAIQDPRGVAAMVIAMEARIAELESEATENARISGMSGEREARHLARIAYLEAENASLEKVADGLVDSCEKGGLKIRALEAALDAAEECVSMANGVLGHVTRAGWDRVGDIGLMIDRYREARNAFDTDLCAARKWEVGNG